MDDLADLNISCLLILHRQASIDFRDKFIKEACKQGPSSNESFLYLERIEAEIIKRTVSIEDLNIEIRTVLS